MAARVDELERWRTGIRIDMHEISEELKGINIELKEIHTLIAERTGKRKITD